jgi:hypothetical protein
MVAIVLGDGLSENRGIGAIAEDVMVDWGASTAETVTAPVGVPAGAFSPTGMSADSSWVGSVAMTS